MSVFHKKKPKTVEAEEVTQTIKSEYVPDSIPELLPEVPEPLPYVEPTPEKTFKHGARCVTCGTEVTGDVCAVDGTRVP